VKGKNKTFRGAKEGEARHTKVYFMLLIDFAIKKSIYYSVKK